MQAVRAAFTSEFQTHSFQLPDSFSSFMRGQQTFSARVMRLGLEVSSWINNSIYSPLIARRFLIAITYLRYESPMHRKRIRDKRKLMKSRMKRHFFAARDWQFFQFSSLLPIILFRWPIVGLHKSLSLLIPTRI